MVYTAVRMMQLVRHASAILFFVLGSLMFFLVILKQAALLAVLDLPLIFFGLLYGGSALLTGNNKEPSTLSTAIVGVLMLAIFVVFLWFNFGFPQSSGLPL